MIMSTSYFYINNYYYICLSLYLQGGFVFSSSSVSEDDIECEDDQIGYETDVDNIDTITVWYNNQVITIHIRLLLLLLRYF